MGLCLVVLPVFPERVGFKGHDQYGIPLMQDELIVRSNLGPKGWVPDVFYNSERGDYLYRATRDGVFDESPVQCPGCRFIGDIDEFDCLGSDFGVFCNRCGLEFDLVGINRVSRCVDCGGWINTKREAMLGVLCFNCWPLFLEAAV